MIQQSFRAGQLNEFYTINSNSNARRTFIFSDNQPMFGMKQLTAALENSVKGEIARIKMEEEQKNLCQRIQLGVNSLPQKEEMQVSHNHFVQRRRALSLGQRKFALYKEISKTCQKLLLEKAKEISQSTSIIDSWKISDKQKWERINLYLFLQKSNEKDPLGTIQSIELKKTNGGKDKADAIKEEYMLQKKKENQRLKAHGCQTFDMVKWIRQEQGVGELDLPQESINKIIVRSLIDILPDYQDQSGGFIDAIILCISTIKSINMTLENSAIRTERERNSLCKLLRTLI